MPFASRTVRALLGLITLVVSQGQAADRQQAVKLTFEKHIRPIFRVHCFDCHGAASELKGGLDLRLVRFLVQGGESGPAITPGKPDESFLLERVLDGEMPPGDAHLSKEESAILRRWIASGAPTQRPEPESIGPGLGITPEDRSFWSFQPIRRAPVRKYPAEARVRTPIDALLLSAMPDGLSFSKDADRLTLIKRAYFDLTGLPPSRDEVSRFLNDRSNDWYEKLIDYLLQSPHYGERWARHWLDVAGYADSEGYTAQDAVRPWAWKYRDYVIRSLNADKPLDRFLVEQLAGDELAGPRTGDLTAKQIELLTATGYLRMAADGTGSGANNAMARNRVMADTLKIVSTSLLGLSLACAQCHDHRYDPIPQTDYYALRAVFEPALDWQQWKTPQERRISLYTQADRQLAAKIEAEAGKIVAKKNEKRMKYMQQALATELLKYEEPLRSQLRSAYKTPGGKRTDQQKELLKKHPSVNITPGVLYQYLPKAAKDLKKYDQKIAKVRSGKPAEQYLRVLIEPANHVPQTRLFHRGDHRQPKDVVAPTALSVVRAEGKRYTLAVNDPKVPTTGRRLAYARWLTSGRHPLVTRVLVNRIWMHHFGQAIVATPGDFGRLGASPTHPKLLDWLADELVQRRWSLKQLHRLMMLSTVYRQSSAPDSGKAAIDPGNRFYWRKPIMRLEAEALRDRMLAAAGDLDQTLYGAPLAIKEDDTGQVVVAGQQTRRSLYILVRRSQPVAMLQAFDAPVMETNCEIRPISTVATQSLMMMNGQFILKQAAQLAGRAGREAPRPPDSSDPLPARAAYAWELALCRQPTAEERHLIADYLAKQLELLKQQSSRLPKNVTAGQQAMTNLCQVLLSSNEFLYVD